jgi:hypothetical protein
MKSKLCANVRVKTPNQCEGGFGLQSLLDGEGGPQPLCMPAAAEFDGCRKLRRGGRNRAGNFIRRRLDRSDPQGIRNGLPGWRGAFPTAGECATHPAGTIARRTP